MNADENSSIAFNDFGLLLNYSNRFIQRRLNGDEASGAGTNADPTVGMALRATDPLSELVWSPKKGLSVKCADRSFFGRKASHLLYSGSGDNIIMGSTSTDNKPLNEADSLNMDINLISEVTERDQFINTPSNAADVAQPRKTSQEPVKAASDIGEGSEEVRGKVVLSTGNEPCGELKASSLQMKTATFSGKVSEESPCSMENEGRDKIMADVSVVRPRERLESSDENDPGTALGQSACVEKNKLVVPISTEILEHCSNHQADEIPGDDKLETKQSPTNSRSKRYQRKGKEKALSAGVVNGKCLDAGSDSDESVESCTSAGVLSKGKRRWNFEEQLNKRVKRHIQDTPGSSSLHKQDSSFVNWISNMVNGFLKTTQQEMPSLAVTVGNPDRGNENLLQCNANQDPASRNTGFQSIFQSLYCPKKADQNSVSVDPGHQKEPRADSQMCDVNATPIACHPVTGNGFKPFLPSSDKHSDSVPTSVAAIRVVEKTSTFQAKDSCSSESYKQKNGTKFNSSEEKARINIGHKIDPFASTWITRFTPKTVPCPPDQGVISNKSTTQLHHCSPERIPPAKSHLQNLLSSSKARSIMEVDEQSHVEHYWNVKPCSTSVDASFSFYKVKSHLGETSSSKVNPILPSQRLSNSEAMASVFARRLDALKLIMPSGGLNDKAPSTMICFFCGMRGHNLRDCSEITDCELEDLLRNITSYEGREEPPCFCIRCFQLNHWAVACPSAPASVRLQEERDTPKLNDIGAVNTQLIPRKEYSKRLLDTMCVQYPVASGTMKNNMFYETTNISRKLQGASSSAATKLKGTQMHPLIKSSSDDILDVPKGICDVVKRLRLSRTDILRWMNSGLPISQLDGFFLRLRLGKWQAGFGGTGYHVACITGGEGTSSGSQPKSGSCVPVDVGGIKCLVESQYVSNNNFLEDELMAWWSATLKGKKVPCEEELRVKLKDKQMLGL
ncbi:hypothetical protein LINPERPRIM_LOCUS17108 [Linum perenne]